MLTEQCKYTVDDVDKIVGYKSWSTKRKIDTLFHVDSTLYCNLGVDSTDREKSQVRTKSRLIYRAIKKIHQPTGKFLLDSMDK